MLYCFMPFFFSFQKWPGYNGGCAGEQAFGTEYVSHLDSLNTKHMECWSGKTTSKSLFMLRNNKANG